MFLDLYCCFLMMDVLATSNSAKYLSNYLDNSVNYLQFATATQSRQSLRLKQPAVSITRSSARFIYFDQQQSWQLLHKTLKWKEVRGVPECIISDNPLNTPTSPLQKHTTNDNLKLSNHFLWCHTTIIIPKQFDKSLKINDYNNVLL